MVADGLLGAGSVEQLQRVGADLLAVVEAVVSDSGGRFVDVGPVLIGGGLGELLVDQIFVGGLPSGLTAQGQLGILGRLVQGLIKFCGVADAALVIGLPVFCSRLEEVEPIPIGRFPCFFRLELVVGLGEGCACEVEGGVAASLDVFGVVIPGLGVLEVGLLVDGVVVVVVVERVDLVGLATGR